MFKINFPVEVYFGRGELKNLPRIAAGYGAKAFVIMDPFLKGSAIQKSVITGLKNEGKEIIEYYEVVSNPRTYLIDQAVSLAVEEKCDFVVAIGGGSAIDAAKAVALLVTNGGNCWDYTERLNAEVARPKKKGLPLIAIPTTAGTGTEATPYAVLSNPELKQKCTIVNPKVFPTVSIVDPELMLSMPPMLTALTGIDAFSHAFESYLNINANPFSEMIALQSMRLFSEAIEKAVEDGHDIQAREKMALCSTLAGMAIAHVGTTLPHALGRPLGGLTDAPHGGTIAACLPEVVKWTLPVSEDKFAKVAEILDPSVVGLPIPERAIKLPDIMESLFARLGVDVSFSGYGLREEQIDSFCDLVYTSFQLDLQGHPKKASKSDLVEIVRACMEPTSRK
ncbi:MAG: iron-containing alcohol dehydrogenase family protein [Bacillota bacterium]